MPNPISKLLSLGDGKRLRRYRRPTGRSRGWWAPSTRTACAPSCACPSRASMLARAGSPTGTTPSAPRAWCTPTLGRLPRPRHSMGLTLREETRWGSCLRAVAKPIGIWSRPFDKGDSIIQDAKRERTLPSSNDFRSTGQALDRAFFSLEWDCSQDWHASACAKAWLPSEERLPHLHL